MPSIRQRIRRVFAWKSRDYVLPDDESDDEGAVAAAADEDTHVSARKVWLPVRPN